MQPVINQDGALVYIKDINYILFCFYLVFIKFRNSDILTFVQERDTSTPVNIPEVTFGYSCIGRQFNDRIIL